MIGEIPSHRGVPLRVLVQESAPLRRPQERVARAPGETRLLDEQFRSSVPDDVVAAGHVRAVHPVDVGVLCDPFEETHV